MTSSSSRSEVEKQQSHWIALRCYSQSGRFLMFWRLFGVRVHDSEVPEGVRRSGSSSSSCIRWGVAQLLSGPWCGWSDPVLLRDIWDSREEEVWAGPHQPASSVLADWTQWKGGTSPLDTQLTGAPPPNTLASVWSSTAPVPPPNFFSSERSHTAC